MKFKKRIIKPGSYRVPLRDPSGKILTDGKGRSLKRTVYVGRKRIATWVDNFKRMNSLGLKIPAPWRHDPKAEPIRLQGDNQDIDAYRNAGFWEKMWQDEQTGELFGEVNIPRDEDASRLKPDPETKRSSVEDCSLLAKEWEDGDGNKFDDTVTHVALVTHPVAKDDTTYEPLPEGSTALSLSDPEVHFIAMADADIERVENEESGEGISASGSTVRDVVKMLDKVANIRLPDDTSGDNLLERLVVALHAVEAKEDEPEPGDDTSVNDPPEKSKQQPGPVAMNEELKLALSLLGDAEVKNPKTGKPYTLEELKALAKEDTQPTVTVQLSEGDQAAINWARGQVANGYQSRLEACVSKGQIDPKTATDFFGRIQKELQEGTLALAFSEGGQPQKNQYDFVIEQWERLPTGTSLTGHNLTSAKAQRAQTFGQQGYSLAAAAVEQDPPTEPEDFNAPMSEEDADAILDIQFANSGKQQSQVRGGFGGRRQGQMVTGMAGTGQNQQI